MSITALIKGMGTGAGLIIAIGAQNAFLLSCAVRRQHAFAVAIVCMTIDAILIIAGVWGLGALIENSPALLALARWGGAAFLLVYGAMALRKAFNPQGMSLDTDSKRMSLGATLITTATLSLLNPHVYLDTVVLLGSIGGQLPGDQPFWFAVGACLASVLWFSLLAWGGQLAAPWFQSAKNWQRLDIFVGLTMWAIAATLVLG